jgi:hypothetical protein
VEKNDNTVWRRRKKLKQCGEVKKASVKKVGKNLAKHFFKHHWPI